MITNLFVQFPEGVTGQSQWDFARTQLILVSHIILGLLLLVGSIVMYVRAIRAKDRNWNIAAGVGFGSILLAIISGSQFISLQKDYYSLLMSLFFVTAIGAYGWGIYKSKA